MEAGSGLHCMLKISALLSSVPITLQNSENGPGAKNGKINSSERVFEKTSHFLNCEENRKLRIGKAENKRTNNSKI